MFNIIKYLLNSCKMFFILKCTKLVKSLELKANLKESAEQRKKYFEKKSNISNKNRIFRKKSNISNKNRIFQIKIEYFK